MYYAIHEKIARTIFIDRQNIKYILSDTYFCPNSIKIKNESVSTTRLTKKEKPRNLNLGEPNEVKSIAFPVSLC